MTGAGEGDEGSGGSADSTPAQGEIPRLGELPGISFAELLNVLQIPHEEFISVCHRAVGGRFSAEVVARVEAAEAVVGFPRDADVWFGPNPTYGSGRRRRGRGAERDVTRWSVFNLDLDVKPDGFKNLGQAQAFIDKFSNSIGMRPTAVIYSGNGLQPVWTVDEEPLDDNQWWARACRASRQIGRLAAQTAYDYCGASLDNVANLDRLVRVPGTTNWKNAESPMPTFAVRDAGQPLSMFAIEDILCDLGVGDIDSDEPVFDETLSDCGGWDFGDHDCEYVVTMVCGWDQDSDRPQAGRHQWAVNKAVRLAAAHRLGCLTEDGLLAALEHLHRSLTHWCETVSYPRSLQHDEVGSAYRWAVAKVSTFDDEQTWRAVGDHCHGQAWSTW